MFLLLLRISYIVIAFYSSDLNAFTLDSRLPDTEMESRAVSLFKITRCPICLGESVYNSQSEFAANMRILIREKIKLGYSDQEIISQLREDYGNQIISIPTHDKKTFFLWYTPCLVFVFITTLFILNTVKKRYSQKKSS